MLRIKDLFPFDIDYSAYVEQYCFRQLLNDDATAGDYADKRPAGLASVDPANATPLPPEYDDLCRLHYLCKSRKVTTVLEFGVGNSTIILASAIGSNRDEYGNFVAKSLRTSQAHELHSVDNYESWISRTVDSMPRELREKNLCYFHQSDVVMGNFSGRICTYYNPLPNISPDFVYVDGPDQFSALGDVRGVSTRHRDRLPMSADLLAIEHFLEPGTLVIVDGRTANARFLAKNFQRNWSYLHVPEWDQHFFELQEDPLGYWNRRKIDFCLGHDYYSRMILG